MEQKIKELTLLLLYLTSWKEEDLPEGMRRSLKGYPFDILNSFTDKDLIRGTKRAKSTYLTKKRIKEAKIIAKKHGIEEDNLTI